VKRRKPNRPALWITPDMSAETCAGAAECARGSQVWKLKNADLSPNEVTSKRKVTLRVLPGVIRTSENEDAVPGERVVVIEVGDTGIGMSEETRAHLFEPFFTTKGVRGTGIGLATVRAILRSYGGHVTVESRLGQGSTFQVHLSVTEAEVAPATVPPTTAVPRGTETVLLVEDDPDLRDLAREVLGEQGYTVLVALTGSEAVRIAQTTSHPIHLLLTDVVMPQMSGPDVVARVQAARPSVRALYMSGYTDATMHATLAADPKAVLLEKPFDAATLAAKVRAVLDR